LIEAGQAGDEIIYQLLVFALQCVLVDIDPVFPISDMTLNSEPILFAAVVSL
jgi:hypothetical protein